MIYLLLKACITGVVVVAISEIAKRSSIFAAVLASLPLTSILAFVWMNLETENTEAIRELSRGIFWMVIPSLAFFIILPALLKTGMRFYPSLLISCMSTAILYAGYTKAISALGIKI
jgi:uncharacterized membrane protein (GlpM family)